MTKAIGEESQLDLESDVAVLSDRQPSPLLDVRSIDEDAARLAMVKGQGFRVMMRVLALNTAVRLSKLELADLLRLSTKNIDRLRKDKRLPREFMLGRRHLWWQSNEIIEWLLAGAPCQQEWDRLRSAIAQWS